VLVRPRLPLTLVALLCLAGCGPPKASTPGHYTLGPTADCLEKSGLEVAKNPPDLDFVTGTAPAGALRSVRSGKRFFIAFGNTEADATIIVKGYQRAAPNKRARRRLRSLLDREGNAVIYWTTEPNAEQSTAVRSCLK
jgi:hypothetical protein